MLYLVFAVLSLHIIALPLLVSATVFVNSDDNVAELSVKLFFIPVFIKKMSVDDIVSHVSDNKNKEQMIEHDENKKANDEQKSNGAFKRMLRSFALCLLKRIRIREIELDARLGLGDAAASAFTVGAVKILYDQLRAIFGFDGGQARISPDYNNESIFFDFFGIISLCFGDIIYAAFAAIISAIFKKDADKRRYYANTVTE